MEIEQRSAESEMQETLCQVKGHYRQLQQVFQNIITNSLKYARADSAPKIMISCKKNSGKDIPAGLDPEEYNKQYNQISIRDIGIGFNQKDAERIFNVFTRLHGNGEYKGTGVGLSIARKVMDNDNEYIVANSEINNEATFHVFFPAVYKKIELRRKHTVLKFLVNSLKVLK